MATNDLPLNKLFGIPEGPIPPVDPADLRRVWEMQRELQARTPGQQIGISVDFYERACSPGANVGAVWFRIAMLEMLRRGYTKASSRMRCSMSERCYLRGNHTIPSRTTNNLHFAAGFLFRF
jgi:hypothetical protein